MSTTTAAAAAAVAVTATVTVTVIDQKPGPPFDPLSRLRSKFPRERSTPTPIFSSFPSSLASFRRSVVAREVAESLYIVR